MLLPTMSRISVSTELDQLITIRCLPIIYAKLERVFCHGCALATANACTIFDDLYILYKTFQAQKQSI